MSATFNERDARMMSVLLNVLVAGMCDPSRLSRGRTYARQGAVNGLHVLPGSLVANVQGSRAQPYEVQVRTSPARAATSANALVPDQRDVIFECSCPDWENPCKHAVAVMARFADLVLHDPAMLVTWRGADAAPGERAVVGSRSLASSRAGVSPAPEAEPEPQVDAAALASLVEFLGQPVSFTPPELTPLPAPREAWDQPWTMMLEEAIELLSTGRTRH